MMHFGPAMMAGSGWMIAFGLGRVLIMALVIFAIVRFARRRSKQVPIASAIQVLNERYAKGEMTEEEYLQRKTVLGK